MKERGILFSAPMVRALLDGTKTQTRRICKPAEAASLSYVVGIQDPRDEGQRPLEVPGSGWFGDEDGDVQFRCPYGQPGDCLWVCETFSDVYGPGGDEKRRKQDVMYRANGETDPYVIGGRWTPSIHMPRWASRIVLEIVSVRVERLQDVSEADALAEGWPHRPEVSDDPQVHADAARDWYMDLWEEINGAGSWAANSWVWVVEFKRVQP
jgi:hypothetical protein